MHDFQRALDVLVVDVILDQFVERAVKPALVSAVEFQLPVDQQPAAQHRQVVLAVHVAQQRALAQLREQFFAEIPDEHVQKTVPLQVDAGRADRRDIHAPG